jgi:hypothetical protein
MTSALGSRAGEGGLHCASPRSPNWLNSKTPGTYAGDLDPRSEARVIRHLPHFVPVVASQYGEAATYYYASLRAADMQPHWAVQPGAGSMKRGNVITTSAVSLVLYWLRHR